MSASAKASKSIERSVPRLGDVNGRRLPRSQLYEASSARRNLHIPVQTRQGFQPKAATGAGESIT